MLHVACYAITSPLTKLLFRCLDKPTLSLRRRRRRRLTTSGADSRHQRRQRFFLSISQFHERRFHRSKTKCRSGFLRLGQSLQFITTGSRYYRRHLLQGPRTLRVDAGNYRGRKKSRNSEIAVTKDGKWTSMSGSYSLRRIS